MDKIKFLIIIGLVGVSLAAYSAFAATSVSLSETDVSVKTGQAFSLKVYVNPIGDTVYTAKVKVDFPAKLVRITSFDFNNKWMPLSQSGYDMINNSGGVLIKTGGYPGGTTSSVLLGTINFVANTEGSGVIKVSNGTEILNDGNANVYSGGGSTNLTIASQGATEPTATTKPKKSEPTDEPDQDIDKPDDSEDKEKDKPDKEEKEDNENKGRNNLMATLGEIFGGGSFWFGFIFALAMVAAGYYITRKKPNSEL